MMFIIAFLVTFLFSLCLVPLVKKFAVKNNILDRPTSERKIHTHPIPLLGGMAVFFSFAIVTIGYAIFTDSLIAGYLKPIQLVGIIGAGIILMIGGYYDDKLNLKPSRSIIAPILASCFVIACGLSIKGISNPLSGGTIHFDQLANEFHSQIIFYLMQLLIIAISFVWMMGMMYTTKYMDGLDGLVTGVGLIAAIIIFIVSQNPTLQQDYVALLAIIFAGALAGFLIYNFNPASIFLGEGGSLFIGLVIASLAIISGTKIATALLVMGVPIFDVAWVITRRIFSGQKITSADKQHLHHRLLNVGFSHRNAVLFIYMLTFLFGVTAIFLQTIYKLYVLGGLVAFMILFGIALVMIYKKQTAK